MPAAAETRNSGAELDRSDSDSDFLRPPVRHKDPHGATKGHPHGGSSWPAHCACLGERPAAARAMRLLVGDDTGLMKSIEVSEVSTIDEEGGSTKSASVSSRWGQQGRDERVSRMCWAGADAAARWRQFAVAHAGGRLELRDTETTGALLSWQAPVVDGAADVVRGLAVSGAAEHDWRLVSCTEAGVVRTWRRADAAEAVDGETAGCDAEWATCGLSGKPLGDANMVTRMRVDRVSCGRLALGGREKELAVWDIATQKAIYTAKNIGNDMLNLRVPVWNADLDFRSGSENELLALTAAREIRHYDMRIGGHGKRRPVYSIPVDGTKMDVGDCRFNAMALYGDHLAICGDVVGGLSMFDLRQRISVGAMAGGGGSVRDISVDEERGMIACCGADRYVRVYSIKSLKKLELAAATPGRSSVGKKMLHRLYLKQRTNGVLIVPAPAAAKTNSTATGTASTEPSAPGVDTGKNKKEKKKKKKAKAKAEADADADGSDTVDPLAAMEAAFGGAELPSTLHDASDSDDDDDDASSSEEEDDDDSEDEEDGDDDDDDDETEASTAHGEAGDDAAAGSSAVAAEENDEDFMQWVLGGAAAAEELENVVPAGEEEEETDILLAASLSLSLSCRCIPYPSCSKLCSLQPPRPAPLYHACTTCCSGARYMHDVRCWHCSHTNGWCFVCLAVLSYLQRWLGAKRSE